MKREFPLFVTAVVGIFMILSFFVPHQLVSVPADFLQQSALIVVAFGYVLGGANVLRVNFDGIYKRQSGWIYKIVLVVALLATMFALLAFFIASAAFRAFRIRNTEAAVLAVAALIVMLGRVPLSNTLTGWLPEWARLLTIQEWIMEFPQNAAKRAILMGAALGVMATGLRVILGLERSYLSGED